MLERVKNYFFSWPWFSKPKDRGDKRSAPDYSDNEEPSGQSSQKRIRLHHATMNGGDGDVEPQPSIFRTLEPREFRQSLASWRPSASNKNASDHTPRLPASKYHRGRDCLIASNKENMSGAGEYGRPKDQLSGFEEHRPTDIEYIEGPGNEHQPRNTFPVSQMRGVYLPGACSSRTGAIRKTIGASKKAPVVTLDSDDDIQVLDQVRSSQSATCMRFNSDPYLIFSGKTTGRPRSSEVQKARLLSQNSKIFPLSMDASSCRGAKSIVTAQRYADERKQFEELISRYRETNKSVRPRPIITPTRYCTAKRDDLRFQDIPILTLDGEQSAKEMVQARPQYDAAPTTLATKIAERLQAAEKPLQRTNSIENRHLQCKYYDSDFLKNLTKNYRQRAEEMTVKLKEPRTIASHYAEHNERSRSKLCEERMLKQLSKLEIIVPEVEVEEVPQLPALTASMQQVIKAALIPFPKTERLVDAFSLTITRYDMQTLSGLNWLNDEIINFYMNLLQERAKEPQFPNIYAHNTFFYPKIDRGGHEAVKRWTRKVDLFAQDLVIVPVHLGVHWCMACVDMKAEEIRYYDSMGNNNNKCLQHLLTYLEKEMKDKKKATLNTQSWTLTNVQKIPQQENGSDCGMFACMYAEYLCRGAKITFSQDDMPYFRQKMVYEIMTKKLLPVLD